MKAYLRAVNRYFSRRPLAPLCPEAMLATSRNAVGFIAGSDQRLHEEAIVISAHMDHLGRVGDAVYPGAGDNASGVAALIEIV